MIHNQRLNNKINHIRERPWRIVYLDHNSSFEGLPAKDGSFKINDRNLQRLLIEIFKVKIKLAPEQAYLFVCKFVLLGFFCFSCWSFCFLSAFSFNSRFKVNLN